MKGTLPDFKVYLVRCDCEMILHMGNAWNLGRGRNSTRFPYCLHFKITCQNGVTPVVVPNKTCHRYYAKKQVHYHRVTQKACDTTPQHKTQRCLLSQQGIIIKGETYLLGVLFLPHRGQLMVVSLVSIILHQFEPSRRVDPAEIRVIRANVSPFGVKF